MREDASGVGTAASAGGSREERFGLRESGVVVLIGSDMRGGGQQREGLPDALRRSLADLASRRPDLGFDVRWYDAVPSTMDIVADAAAAGERPGFVAIADRQTAGRGRRGHAWSSPPGAGLYFSYLARAKRHVGLVTLAAGQKMLDEPLGAGDVERVAIRERRDHGRNDAGERGGQFLCVGGHRASAWRRAGRSGRARRSSSRRSCWRSSAWRP